LKLLFNFLPLKANPFNPKNHKLFAFPEGAFRGNLVLRIFRPTSMHFVQQKLYIDENKDLSYEIDQLKDG